MLFFLSIEYLVGVVSSGDGGYYLPSLQLWYYGASPRGGLLIFLAFCRPNEYSVPASVGVHAIRCRYNRATNQRLLCKAHTTARVLVVLRSS